MSNYSIYITNGPDAYKKGVAFGGDHITVAKKQKFKGADLKKIVNEVADKNLKNELCSKDWKPKKWEIKKWKVGKGKTEERYIMVISSNRLEEVAAQLSDKKVHKLMGPGNGKAKFHVTLPKNISSKAEAEKYAETLVKTQKWYLTVVNKDDHCKRVVNAPLMQ